MALSRRNGQRFQSSIWPGFVDAMTGLLLVLMFVLTIFMVVQFVLRETITGQESELDSLSAEVSALAQALGLEQRRAADLDTSLAEARSAAETQAALIATLTREKAALGAELVAAQNDITGFEAQVAGLLAERDRALGSVAALESEREGLISQQEALQLALAQARGEIDAQAEAARLAAARREALEALAADLRRAGEADKARVADLQSQLSDEEAQRLAEAAAAEVLRERLKNADAELTAMTLTLEAERKKAEDTLTLLAAAEAAGQDLNARLATALLAREEVEAALAEAQNSATDSEALRQQLAAALAAKLAAEQTAAAQMSAAEERATLLAAANRALSQEEALSAESQRKAALLNQQIAALRTQLSGLQALLDDAKERDAAAQVQLQSLGTELNTALARVAAEERKRRQLEEAENKRLEQERARLEAEAKNLENYKSEFFGRMRAVLGAREGVQIVGDRFVFSSEVLFPPGGADLSEQGRGEIAKIAGILRSIADEIPEGIDWVIRVDGHTDNVPLSGRGAFADNWELSQARALAVVRYMVDAHGIAPEHLSANGFGEFQPVNRADTPEARAQNRRIELKLTEK